MQCRRYIYLFVAIALCIGCTKSTKIGILFDTDNGERWVNDKERLTKQILQHNARPYYFDSDGTHKSQLEQLKYLIEEGISLLIIVAADLNKASEIVQLANKHEIMVIAYDRLIKNCMPDFYISFDNIEVGKMQAGYLTKVSPDGNYALIGGATSDNNSYLLRIGQLNVLQSDKHNDHIKIVYDQLVDEWSAQEGYEHMIACLQKNTNIDAVLAANDELADGAIQALKESGLAKPVYISGQDATLQGCRNILQGYQTMTVYKPIEIIVDSTISVAFDLLEGNFNKDRYNTIYNGKSLIPSLLIDPVLVHKDNIDSTVLKKGYIDPTELYKGL
ncbi:MAG: substrate-binding domain-containing protein [Bacteroidetes bacterium]|jgi:D-xylose ABC transporter substrate-binding protein|nr:substrate-binding domain-containing protein [Bacteroidota bacterium]